MDKLTVKGACVVKDNAELLRDADAVFAAGELAVIVGPNGAGKTTLLSALLGLTPLIAGAVTLNKTPLEDLAPAQRARAIAYIPQEQSHAWPMAVRASVGLGRYAYGASPGALAGEDAAAVERALTDCALTPLQHRSVDTLSGGERARVACARAFAAETPFLLADEPVAALDPAHQLNVMTLLRRYADQGGGAVVVMHDLSLAARFATRLLWMKDGRIVADGAPKDTLTATRMRDVFEVDARISLGDEAAHVAVVGPSA
ncbi:MAG: ABC transporter ATP-binding protein [Pseudomonadota bacterium]